MDSDNLKRIVGENINYYLEINNISKREMALKLGVASSTLCDWTNGKKYPRMKYIEKMAEYFNVPKSALIEDRKNAPVTERDRSIEMAMNLFKQLTPEEKLDIICYASEILNKRGEH